MRYNVRLSADEPHCLRCCAAVVAGSESQLSATGGEADVLRHVISTFTTEIVTKDAASILSTKSVDISNMRLTVYSIESHKVTAYSVKFNHLYHTGSEGQVLC